MKHLYDDGNVIHACEGARAIEHDLGTYLVWTLCGKDVPADESFKSDEASNCPDCIHEVSQ